MKADKTRLEELKKQHRKVYAIEVNDDGEDFSCYLKRPNPEQLAVMNKLAKTDEVRATQTLIDQCWIEGDSVIKADGMLLMAIAGEFLKECKVNNVTVLKN